MEVCATESERRRRWRKERETEEKNDGESAMEKNDGVGEGRRRRTMETSRRSRRETEENVGERLVTKSGSERGERWRREEADEGEWGATEKRSCRQSNDGERKKKESDGGEGRIGAKKRLIKKVFLEHYCTIVLWA